MDTLKTLFAAVGLVVTVAVAVWGTMKVLARYGSHITMWCRRADAAIKAVIRKAA